MLLEHRGAGTAARRIRHPSLIPLGLTLIPFLLAWRAGRRLARASYTDQLWQALLGSWLMYGAFGFATGFSAAPPTSASASGTPPSSR